MAEQCGADVPDDVDEHSRDDRIECYYQVWGAREMAERIVDLEDIGPHYARTLAEWRRNLFANERAVRERGYPETLLRMWDFYLSYCEGGFAERALGDVHMVLQDTRRAVAPTPRV